MGSVFRNLSLEEALGVRNVRNVRGMTAGGSAGRFVRILSSQPSSCWLSCTPRAQRLDFSACTEFMSSRCISQVNIASEERVDGGTTGDNGHLVVDIKCIVFRVKSRPEVPAVVIVIDQRYRVDLKKVAECLDQFLEAGAVVRRQDVAMVDGGSLVDVVGFPVGEVPPFGFPSEEVVRIVDDALVHEHSLVRFGPGEGDVVIRGTDLLASGGVAADVRGKQLGSDKLVDGDLRAERDHLHDIGAGFQNAEPHRFEMVLRVVRKRKLAKRLLFATVVPALHGGRQSAYVRNARNSGSSLVWRHPETCQKCELQLIVGKTIERRYGAKFMEQTMLKRIVKGGYLRVTGVVQANSKNDACVDVVVHDLETLGTSLTGLEDERVGIMAPTSATSAGMPDQLAQRPTQQPYVNLTALKMRKKRKTVEEDDLMPEYEPARKCDVKMVTTMEDLLRVREALSASTAVSLDAEWRPSTRQGRSNPVSLLQLGVVGADKTSMDVYLIDMLELCFYNHNGFDRALSAEQRLLSDVLETMFGSDVPKLGFGLRYDIKRLRESYPWLPCFGGHAPITSHIDVGMLGRLAGKVKVHKNLSLSKLTAAVLNARLSKQEQMSDWGHRPLNERQISYASHDVACLVDLYDAILSASAPDILSARGSMDFVSLNLTELGSGHGAMGVGPGWYSGPDDGDERPVRSGLDANASELDRLKGRSKKLPIKYATCNPDLARSYLGDYVTSSGKEGAARAILPPEEAQRHSHAKRGGAMLELANAFLFFVNVPSRNYPNEFTDDGRMSWFSSRGQTLDHPVIKRILDGEKTLTLWCRRDKERYAYFGELAVDSVIEQEDGSLKVWYRLRDWDAISSSPTVAHVLAGNTL